MRKLIIAAVCAACGLLAAYTLTASASGPVTLPDLPGLGYSLSMQFDAQTQCGIYTVISGNGVSSDIPIGDIPPVCVSADVQAARIAGLLRDFPPATATTSTASVLIETVHDTTTVAVTTTLAADPVPALTVTLPAVTVASPPAVQTVTVVSPPEVQTVTVAAVPLDPGWLVALGIRSAAMNVVYGLA